MSPPRRRRARPCGQQGTGATNVSHRQVAERDEQRSPFVEAPVGPEFAALVAALLHLEEALGFPCGIPTQRQTTALRSTRRYRALVAHLPEAEEGP